MKLRILALDLATQTGWAMWDGLHLDSGTVSFKTKTSDSPGVKYMLFNSWLDKMIKTQQPDIIVYEMPHLRGHASSQLLLGFVTRVHEACVRDGRDIEHREYHSGSIKKFACGHGKSSKDAMIDRAWELYPEQGIKDDNQADALHICALAAYELTNVLIGDYNAE
jgi:Holliday junction resolvasome RuvABC endonuclease subunit